MTISEMKKRKIELGLTNEMLAEKANVPLSTIQKIFCGATKAPRKSTLDALAGVLRPTEEEILAKAAVYTANTYDSGSGTASVLRDPGAGYAVQRNPKKKPGDYTIEDYYAMPSDRRVELIDGAIYDMASPSLLHQVILSRLHRQFDNCIDAHHMPCTVISSPGDVQLDLDDRTMLQPDLYITCKELDLRSHAFPGAPDLVVEVLSPSTRSYDMFLKAYKYAEAGVREYWIVDPEQRSVIVHEFSNGDRYPTAYPFESKIPVLISEGRCSIDFEEISREIASAYEE